MEKRVSAKFMIAGGSPGPYQFLPQAFFLEAIVVKEDGTFSAYFDGTEGAIEGGGPTADEAVGDLIEAFSRTIESLMESGHDEFVAAMEAYGYRCVNYIEPVHQRIDDEYIGFFGHEGTSWLPPAPSQAQI